MKLRIHIKDYNTSGWSGWVKRLYRGNGPVWGPHWRMSYTYERREAWVFDTEKDDVAGKVLDRILSVSGTIVYVTAYPMGTSERQGIRLYEKNKPHYKRGIGGMRVRRDCFKEGNYEMGSFNR